MWCIFVCHPHLTIIICRTAVWAQACGSEHKTSLSLSCIIGLFGVLDCFLIPVVCLVGAVSRYCHSWYRLFGPQQPWQIFVRCVLVNTLQYHDTGDFFRFSFRFRTEDPQLVAEPAVDETMARQWERVDEDTAVGPRFGQDPPSFSEPTPSYTYRQWERDLRLWQATSSLQKNRQG